MNDNTNEEIEKIGTAFEWSDEKIRALKYASKMSAKVDNTAIQSGYPLYHHAFIMDEVGRWTVIQQGMNVEDGTARRYHWLSDHVKSFIVEPHDAIVCDGTGVLGLVNGRGFWSQLTEEQRTELATMTQEMLETGESQEAIRAMKAGLLEEWGIEAPLWSGPHSGEQGPHGQQLRDGSGAGGQYGGRGNGSGNRGSGNNGVCPN